MFCNLKGIEAMAWAFVKNFFCFAVLCFASSASAMVMQLVIDYYKLIILWTPDTDITSYPPTMYINALGRRVSVYAYSPLYHSLTLSATFWPTTLSRDSV